MTQAAVYTAAAILSEARGLLLRGWCRCAQARDSNGRAVPAWSENAHSWSLLGALLASWHGQQGAEALSTDDTVVANLLDTRALGDATQALGEVTGTASLEQWNDEPGRSVADVIAAVDLAVARLTVQSG